MIKKLLMVVSLVGGIATFAGAFGLEPADHVIPQGLQFATLYSTGQAFKGAGTIYKIVPSTGNTVTEWFQIFDTQPAQAGLSATNYSGFVLSSTQSVTPPLLFFSTNATNVNLGAAYDYNPYGVTVQNGALIFFGNTPTAVSATGVTGRSVTVYYNK